MAAPNQSFAYPTRQGRVLADVADQIVTGARPLLRLIIQSEDRALADKRGGGLILDAAIATRLGMTGAQLKAARDFLVANGLIHAIDAEMDSDLP